MAVTTDDLVVAGCELADEVGFAGVTLSELARRFRVKTPSLYSHVKNSHDLKTRIALRALADLADLASDAIAGRSGKQALEALGAVYRDYARRYPGRYAAAQFPLDTATAAASAGPKNAAAVRAVLRGYDLDEPDQTHAVRLLGSVFHGYVSLELGGGFSHSAPDSDASWDRVMDVLDALLRAWPGRPGTTEGEQR